MKKLSQVLEPTKLTTEFSAKVKGISNMPVHGLTIEGGKTTTPSINKQNHLQSDKRCSSDSQTQTFLSLHNDAAGQNKLCELLTICFDTLDTYGKTEEQLESAIKVFQLVLKDYTYNEVEQAIYRYMQVAKTMPKPADIINIINPPKKKREFCKVTFLDIKRRMRENQFITFEEEQYIRDFLDAAVSTDEGQRELVQTAIEQAERENRKYWLSEY